MQNIPKDFLSEDYWKNEFRQYEHILSPAEFLGYQTKFFITHSELSELQQVVVLTVIVNAIDDVLK